MLFHQVQNCDLAYIDETERKFNQRLDEHKVEVNKVANNIRTSATKKALHSTVDKSAITDHLVDSITTSRKYKRWIKEVISMRR